MKPNEPRPVAFWRLREAIENVAVRRRLDGDMFDESQPTVGTLAQQIMILDVLHELPLSLTRTCPTLAKLMATRLVLSSTATNKPSTPDRQSTPDAPTSPIAQELRRAAKRVAKGGKRCP